MRFKLVSVLTTLLVSSPALADTAGFSGMLFDADGRVLDGEYYIELASCASGDPVAAPIEACAAIELTHGDEPQSVVAGHFFVELNGTATDSVDQLLTAPDDTGRWMQFLIRDQFADAGDWLEIPRVQYSRPLGHEEAMSAITSLRDDVESGYVTDGDLAQALQGYQPADDYVTDGDLAQALQGFQPADDYVTDDGLAQALLGYQTAGNYVVQGAGGVTLTSDNLGGTNPITGGVRVTTSHGNIAIDGNEIQSIASGGGPNIMHLQHRGGELRIGQSVAMDVRVGDSNTSSNLHVAGEINGADISATEIVAFVKLESLITVEAPIVEFQGTATLPTCTIDLRGQVRFQLGVVDRLRVCGREADGDYGWQDLF